MKLEHNGHLFIFLEKFLFTYYLHILNPPYFYSAVFLPFKKYNDIDYWFFFLIFPAKN